MISLLLAAAMWISPTVEMENVRVAAFRKNTVNASEVTHAEWRISSLGVFNAYVNGMRVGEDWLAPGCTYNVKCRHEAAYDVTG
ncbi:MAG: alpha-L-rhamnosidase N-terminal domain-containing protein, partial [Kiritimatiellae bacterium]|nr:alpha-L-rhamnosidase N-terminal domain-containing protein [Kiritimatiellia bacterium]